MKVRHSRTKELCLGSLTHPLIRLLAVPSRELEASFIKRIVRLGRPPVVGARLSNTPRERLTVLRCAAGEPGTPGKPLFLWLFQLLRGFFLHVNYFCCVRWPAGRYAKARKQPIPNLKLKHISYAV